MVLVAKLSIANDLSQFLEEFITRHVIVHRDENGYGFTVSGDNPVYVQSVKERKLFIFDNFPLYPITPYSVA